MPSDEVRKSRLQWLGHVARMPDERLPKQILFGWLPQARPAHRPRLRREDRVHSDLRTLKTTEWFLAASDRSQWRDLWNSRPEPVPPAPAVPCNVCARVFKSQSGFKRHKCSAVRNLPISAQPGAVQCATCLRWLKSRGGLAVHKCRPTTPAREPLPETRQTCAVQAPQRQPITTMPCCKSHCSRCSRCFRSRPGFHRHNCHRGQRTNDRGEHSVVCSICDRRFHFERDKQRHKCRPV